MNIKKLTNMLHGESMKHFQKDFGNTVFHIGFYCCRNKWYLPFGFAFWDRYVDNPTCYYKHLVEFSIGILFVRIQFQWWRKHNV